MSSTLLRATKEEKSKFRKNYSPIKFKRWQGELTIPKNKSPLPHQPASALYSLSRNRSYLGLAPGLGKTPIAAMIAQALQARTLYITPKMLEQNVHHEMSEWTVGKEIHIMSDIDWNIPDILIVPDSMLAAFETRRLIRAFNPECIIIDEAHRYKEMTTQRTQALLGHKDEVEGYIPGVVDRRDLKCLVYMSGTPMPNRPIELYPIIAKSCPEYIDFKNRIEYGLTYCQGFYDGRGYDFRGCNKKQLEVLKSSMVSKDAKDRYGFMLRLQKDILNLPPLIEEVVVLGDGRVSKELKELQSKILKKFTPDDLVKMHMLKKLGKEDLHISTYKRLLGMEKIKYVAEYVEDILETTDESILLAASHIDVVEGLGELLKKFNPFVVTGENTNSKQRHSHVKEFQSSKRRLFISNIEAIGVGFTLTKAHRAILCEFSWVPGTNRQLIDRIHRYGLKHSVLAQYVALANSMDKQILEALSRKEKITALI